MHHCVGDYFRGAVRGSMHFFHVEHRGESATIAVRHGGLVEEVNGPFNEPNGACRWAARFFRKWRREWRRKLRRPRARTLPGHEQLGLPGLDGPEELDE